MLDLSKVFGILPTLTTTLKVVLSFLSPLYLKINGVVINSIVCVASRVDTMYPRSQPLACLLCVY